MTNKFVVEGDVKLSGKITDGVNESTPAAIVTNIEKVGNQTSGDVEARIYLDSRIKEELIQIPLGYAVRNGIAGWQETIRRGKIFIPDEIDLSTFNDIPILKTPPILKVVISGGNLFVSATIEVSEYWWEKIKPIIGYEGGVISYVDCLINFVALS